MCIWQWAHISAGKSQSFARKRYTLNAGSGKLGQSREAEECVNCILQGWVVFPLSVRGQRCTLCNTVIPHFIVARPQGEGDYNVNHRRLHIGPCKCSQGMYGNNCYIISSATWIISTCWICKSIRNWGRVTYRWTISTFTDPDSSYCRVAIRWGILVRM